MDLISREAIDNLTKSDTKGSDYDRGWNDALYSADILPSAFEGMTYGEVMKAVLGIKDEQIAYGEYVNVIRLKRDPDSFMSFDSKVWDSPYKAVDDHL